MSCLGSRVRSTAMDCETLPGHGYNGICTSPNGVFMALYENKRKLFHYKKGATAVEGEVDYLISKVSLRSVWLGVPYVSTLNW